MEVRKHADCYGKLFPSGGGKETPGIVFALTNSLSGVIHSQRVAVDLAAWDRCTGCAEFEGCYRLSTAKLLADFAFR